jgi:plastocyanin
VRVRVLSASAMWGLGLGFLCVSGAQRVAPSLVGPIGPTMSAAAASTPLVSGAVATSSEGASPVIAASGSELSGRVDILDKDKKRTPGANSVVWIPGLAQSGAATAAMASQDKHFAPHVLVVAAGTDVSFPNLDPIFHNVFSLTPENKFDLGLYRKGAAKSVRMATPSLVRIYCNIHSDMAAFVMVLDHAAFVVADADGAYRFAALPAGQYSVHAWNERTGEQIQKIAIDPSAPAPAGAAPKLDFPLDASAYRAVAHTNKYGRVYPPVSKDVDRY